MIARTAPLGIAAALVAAAALSLGLRGPGEVASAAPSPPTDAGVRSADAAPPPKSPPKAAPADAGEPPFPPFDAAIPVDAGGIAPLDGGFPISDAALPLPSPVPDAGVLPIPGLDGGIVRPSPR